MINLDAHQSVRQISALLKRLWQHSQRVCRPLWPGVAPLDVWLMQFIDEISVGWWKSHFNHAVWALKISFSAYPTNKRRNTYCLGLRRYDWFFSLHFHLSIETAIDFVFFTHFISEKEQDYNYSSSSVSEDSKQTIVYPKRLFGWTSLLCGYTLRLYISDCICQLLSARSHLCFVIDSNIVSRKRFLADFTFLHLKDNRFE